MKTDKMNRVIESAYKGKSVWEKWKREFPIENTDCVLVFPDANETVNKAFLDRLPELLEKRSYKRAILVIQKENIELWNPGYRIDSKYCICRMVNRKEIYNIMKLYSILEFSNRLYICSLEQPDGRMGKIMLSPQFDCTLDEIICAGVFRIC